MRFHVAGVWRDYARQHGAIVIDRADYVRLTGDARINDAALWLKPGVDTAAIEAALRALPGGTLLDMASPGQIRKVSLAVFDPLGRLLGLPDYGGSFLVGSLLFLVGAAIIETRLRPDPLVLAGGVGSTEAEGRLPFRTSIRLIVAHPNARLAVLGMMVSQATMVGVMTLTPLYMKKGGQSKNAIAVMLFVHILGMYALSPIVGKLADRLGRYPMLVAAGALCVVGAMWAGASPGDGFVGLTGGLAVIGLAWSFGIIASSGLLSESFPVSQRASIQGAGDLCMSSFGALAGISAGAIVASSSYRTLNIAAAGLGVVLLAAIAATAGGNRARPHPQSTTATAA